LDFVTIHYATHPTSKGPGELLADLYLPPVGAPADLLVWMHSGGFRSGSRRQVKHEPIARAFAAHGFASAFIDYRLARPPAVLAPDTAAALPALVLDAERSGEEMQPIFFGARALAVVEDCCAFLRYIDGRRAAFGLSGRYYLAGSSAGAISALNTLYLPRHLGLARPDVAGVLAFSGGFAYPAFLQPTGARILALNSPHDGQMPVSSIRRLKIHVPDQMILIESEGQGHGALTLSPDEPLTAAVLRCVTFIRAKDPLALRLAPSPAGPAPKRAAQRLR